MLGKIFGIDKLPNELANKENREHTLPDNKDATYPAAKPEAKIPNTVTDLLIDFSMCSFSVYDCRVNDLTYFLFYNND